MVNIIYLLTVKDYARLCGVAVRTVQKRIYKHTIYPVIISNIKFIDINRYPSAKRAPHKKKQDKTPPPAMHYINISDTESVIIKDLVAVRHYAKRLKIRSGTIYERMLRGNIAGIIIGDIIFIDAKKYPPEQFIHVKEL